MGNDNRYNIGNKNNSINNHDTFINIEKNITMHNISYDVINDILYSIDNTDYKLDDIMLFIYDHRLQYPINRDSYNLFNNQSSEIENIVNNIIKMMQNIYIDSNNYYTLFTSLD